MKPKDKKPQADVETDPRFPSGPWTGFWIQHGIGTQRMSLSLSFLNGRVTGCGKDIVGRFDFSGTYDLTTGRVALLKQYEKAHRVAYDGANQGDGMWLWGVWSLRHLRGGFHIWPEGEDDPTQRRLEKSLDQPTTISTVRLAEGELLPARS